MICRFCKCGHYSFQYRLLWARCYNGVFGICFFLLLHFSCRFTVIACYVFVGGVGGDGGGGGLKSVGYLMKDSCNRSQFVCNLPALKYVSSAHTHTHSYLQMRTNLLANKLELVTTNDHKTNSAPLLFLLLNIII